PGRQPHASLNLISNVRLRQIPDSYQSPRNKCALAQIVNRTKTFHVKQFCPIGPRNRTKLKSHTSPSSSENRGRGGFSRAGSASPKCLNACGVKTLPRGVRWT